MATQTALTRQQRKAARIAAVKCIHCGIGLGQGKSLYSIGRGKHVCETHLHAGAR